MLGELSMMCCVDWRAAIVAAIVSVSWVSAASADSFGSGANQFNIDFVTIPGAAGDGYGGQSAGGGFTTTNIAHDYRIGVYEVTNDQWTKFTNSLGVPVTGDPVVRV
jgi:formylglycine-generating enzyme required for sulfatase activity